MTQVPVGAHFGLWLVISEAQTRGRYRYWHCRCECGTQRTVNAANLERGLSRSCGCLKAKEPNHITHGLSGTVICKLWRGMLARCYSKATINFDRYGGRGIKVCEFLRSSPCNLLALIGERPSPFLSIGRINNDGMYSCGACAECLQNDWPLNIRWETDTQQARNRNTTHLFTIDGVTKSLAEWSEITGIASYNLRRRKKRGVNPLTGK
jgi:hypothetical protein